MRSLFEFGRARHATFASVISLCTLFGAVLVWSAPALAQHEHAFSASFGAAGSGNGQLSRPGSLAVNDTTGDVYVIDRGNGRVEEFSATGAYVGQFNGSASPTGVFSWPLSAAEDRPEGAIAVDNSTNPLDPSAGDVYVADTGHNVIDKFSASGVYISQVLGTSPEFPFRSVFGIAVDASGALWVQGEAGGHSAQYNYITEFRDGSVNEFVSETKMRFIDRATGSERSFLGLRIGFAIDSQGDFYVGQSEFNVPGPAFVAKFNRAGTILVEEVGGEEAATGVAIDRSSNDVYIDNEMSVAAFDPSGYLIERFGSGQMNASAGIAVNSSSGALYTSDATNQTIEVFTAFVVPDVTTGSVSSLGETSATVGGVVNPDGLHVTSCVFEYGTTTSYGQTAPCSSDPGSGSAPVAVGANLSGLERLTHYHFRLKVSNANGSNVGQDHTFLTPAPVVVGETSVADVTSGSAQFSAQVNPGGADTTFRFEYGTSMSYGQSVPAPEGDIGALVGVEPVSVRPEDLQPETTYHVRIAATNLLGTVYGPDEMFTTQSSSGAFALLDSRRWEMVSPPNKYGAGIEPLPSQGVVEAAEDGSAIAYLTNGPIVASSAGNPTPAYTMQVLSRHGRPAGRHKT